MKYVWYWSHVFLVTTDETQAKTFANPSKNAVDKKKEKKTKRKAFAKPFALQANAKPKNYDHIKESFGELIKYNGIVLVFLLLTLNIFHTLF